MLLRYASSGGSRYHAAMVKPDPLIPPESPLPKIDYYASPAPRPSRWKIGATLTAILMLLLLLPLARMIIGKDGPFFYVLTGRLFLDPFSTDHVGSVLDQPTIGKWYILSGFFSFISLLWMTIIRLISRRSRLTEHLAYALPAAATCFLLLVMLTLPFWWNIQYLSTMGFTLTRLKGLIFGSVLYLLLLAFLIWSLRRPRA